MFNVLGCIAFVWVASFYWIEPNLADVPGASGGAFFLWGEGAVPILLGFVVLDLLWVLRDAGFTTGEVRDA